MNNFIQELSKRRSNYNAPDQATMQENSLEKLSSGIYTEGERFVFELLQNAVDAHSDFGMLDISIVVQDGYLVFMHNGDTFTNEDIEAICFVGRKGEKTRNIKKIGYKGIGFKSVFGISNKVFIHSGDNCFCFDKSYWQNYWKKNWKSEYGEYDTSYTMPWQVIPIESQLPIHIDENGAHVATYIEIADKSDEQKLVSSIKTLMQSSRFLIFLKDKNIRMRFTYNHHVQCEIEKKTKQGIIVLMVNGKEDSQWLVHSNPNVQLHLTTEEQRKIEKDKNLPEKLKKAESFDLSFAIELKDGKLIETDNAVLYTYLPTSFKFGDTGFPFLVNANFITDEGRQHLDIDAEWNRVIVSKIPEEYLRWMASLSTIYPNYYEVLPEKSYGNSNELVRAYSEAMKNAIAKIAFIPSRQNGSLIKVGEALMDRMNISEAITPALLVAHIKRMYDQDFDCSKSLISSEGYTILKSYGVFAFDKIKFKTFFDDTESISGISIESDTKLINLLCAYIHENASDKEELNQAFSKTKFILNQDGILMPPKNLCFTASTSNDLNSRVDYINANVYDKLSQPTLDWLAELGVTDSSDTSLIDAGTLFKDNFITKDNVIEIGRFVFRLFCKNKISETQFVKLRAMKVLTTEGNLINAESAYFSNDYLPSLPLEGEYAKDWYISPSYISTPSDKSKMKEFFLRIGVCQNAEIESPDVCLGSVLRSSNTSKSRKGYLTQLFADLNTIPGEWAWESKAYANFTSIKILDECIDNYTFAKNVWNAIFNNSALDVEELVKDIDVWKFHCWHRQCYTKWLIENENIIPVTTQKCVKCQDAYSNTIPHILEIAHDILPILDYNSPIPSAWQEILPMKDHLSIEDYLDMLANYSERKDFDMIDIKHRIVIIYGILVDLLPTLNSSQRDNMSKWGKINKLLAKDNKFYRISELSYITISGFNSTKIIYTEEQDSNLIELFKLFGIKVIDHIEPSIEHAVPCNTFKERLLERTPLMAILSMKDRSFVDEVDKIRERIKALNLCHTDKIKLSYGDENDIQERSYFYNKDDNSFYFTGEWEKPRVLISIVEPLCEILHIKRSYSNILSIILSESSFSDGKEYLKEQGFDTKCISNEYIPQVNQTFKGLTAREEMELIESDVNDGNVPSDGVSTNARVSFAEEAQGRIMELLRKNNCAFDTSGHSYTVLYSITLPDGSKGKAIMKSAKGGYLYFTPREWLGLATGNSMLLLVDQNNQVKNVNIEELEESNDHFHMRFDTRTFAVHSNLKVFAKFFRPMPQGSVYFVFGVPYGFSKANYLDEFGLDKQNKSAIDVTEDDVNMLN